jgi:UDP-N-acetylmuramate--alanine ligase
MTSSDKKLVSKQELIPAILASDAPIIVTIGAGDLGELVPNIKNAINETI